MQQRQWVEFLQEFSFEIKYTLGKKNQVVDALSRRGVALAITLVQSSLLDEILQKILMDTFFGTLILEIQNQREHKSLEDYIWKEGLLYFNGRLCILNELQKQILKEAHETPLAAHRGYHKMFASLKEQFFWPKMKKYILEFCKQCLVCQKFKAKRVKIPGKLKPLDFP